jgi:AraC-like DNA-binding protein
LLKNSFTILIYFIFINKKFDHATAMEFIIENTEKENQTYLWEKKSKHLSILDINPVNETRSTHYPILSYPPARQICASPPSEKYKNIITYYHQIIVPENNLIRTIYPTGNAGIVFVCDRHKPRAFFVGILTHPREAEYTVSSCEYFVVLLWPGISYAFFPIPQIEIADKYISLNEILPGKSESLTEKITLAGTYQERVRIFEDFMYEHLCLLKEVPDRLLHIIFNIYQNMDNAKNIQLPSCTYSERHMRRLFQNYIGITPQLFRSIIRLQKTLKILNRNPREDMADLAVKQGYYDQSHFIKEFKKFYNYTPSSFINEFIQTDNRKPSFNI